MASLDKLEGDLVEALGLVLLFAIAVILFLAWFEVRQFNPTAAFSTFAGNISNGLYNLNAPDMIAKPVNSALSHIAEWLNDTFWKPGTQANPYGGVGDPETVSLGDLLDGGN